MSTVASSRQFLTSVLLLLLLSLCCSPAVFQSDPLTLVESTNGNLKMVFFTPNTSGVAACVVCVLYEREEKGSPVSSHHTPPLCCVEVCV